MFKRHTASKADVRLHSEVNAQNISDMLEKQHGLIVGVARIDLPTPIKTLGMHTVKVRVDDAIEEEYAASAVTSAAEGQAEENVDEANKKQKKGASKKKWLDTKLPMNTLSETPRKTLAKTTQKLKLQKSKAKSTHHIIWRGKKITEFGEKKDVITHRECVVLEHVIVVRSML
ncbi:hypothetical protein PsorP6_018342 [Peronosclerospora sorghi]|nr:hypothetical protein PsorP6_018342 [Peronosclerospora sorghi]